MISMATTEFGLQYKDIKVDAGPSPIVGFQDIEEKQLLEDN